MKINGIILIIGLAALGSCYYDVEEELYPVSSTSNPTDSTGTDTLTKVTYVGDIKTIITKNCTSCHFPNSGIPDLTTYTGVKKVAANGLLNQKVIIEKSMPPNGPLADKDLSLLDSWIKNNAPEN